MSIFSKTFFIVMLALPGYASTDYADLAYRALPRVQEILLSAKEGLKVDERFQPTAEFIERLISKLNELRFESPGRFCGNTTRAYTLMLGNRDQVYLCPQVLKSLPEEYLPQLILHELIHASGEYDETAPTFYESALFLLANTIPIIPHDRAYGHDHSDSLLEFQRQIFELVYRDTSLENKKMKIQISEKSAARGMSTHCRWHKQGSFSGLMKSTRVSQKIDSSNLYRSLELTFAAEESVLQIICFYPDRLNFYFQPLRRELSALGDLQLIP